MLLTALESCDDACGLISADAASDLISPRPTVADGSVDLCDMGFAAGSDVMIALLSLTGVGGWPMPGGSINILVSISGDGDTSPVAEATDEVTVKPDEAEALVPKLLVRSILSTRGCMSTGLAFRLC